MTDHTEREELVKRLREKFEAWISAMPYERSILKWPTNSYHAWPGQYKDIAVQVAWEAATEFSTLTAQPQGEPLTHVIGDDKDGNEVVVKLRKPLYTAPQPGVREGMLRAAEICGKRADGWGSVIGNEYATGRKKEAELLATTITRAAEQINAEGQIRPEREEVSAVTSTVASDSAPSAPHAEQTHVSVPEGCTCDYEAGMYPCRFCDAAGKEKRDGV